MYFFFVLNSFILLLFLSFYLFTIRRKKITEFFFFSLSFASSLIFKGNLNIYLVNNFVKKKRYSNNIIFKKNET